MAGRAVCSDLLHWRIYLVQQFECPTAALLPLPLAGEVDALARARRGGGPRRGAGICRGSPPPTLPPKRERELTAAGATTVSNNSDSTGALDRHDCAISPHVSREVCHQIPALIEIRGRREDRVRAAPAVSRAKC